MEPSTVVLVAVVPVVYCIAGAARFHAIAKSARLAHRRPAPRNDDPCTASVIALAAAAAGNRGIAPRENTHEQTPLTGSWNPTSSAIDSPSSTLGRTR
jgi:hypothetical protein